MRIAVDLGFAQVSHGARTGLDSMGESDGIVYYSPRTEYPDGDVLRHFTAVGRVADDQVYQALALDWKPWRRRVDWERMAESAPVRPLIGALDFTRNAPNWGYQLRAGHLEISRHDFDVIREAMQRPSPDDRKYPEERRWA